MAKISANSGSSDKNISQVNDPADVPGLRNFTTAPLIGGVGLSSFVAATDEDVTGIKNFTAAPTVDGDSLRDFVVASTAATRPASTVAENLPRRSSVLSTLAALTSGTLRLVHMALNAGDVVTSVAFTSIGAATVPTNQWFALLNSDRLALAFTANDTTTAWGANTRKSLTLTAPVVATYTGLYYVGIMVTADAVPTLAGVSSTSVVTGQVPSLGGNTSDTGLTTVPGSPFTAGTITASGLLPYVAVA